MLKKSMAKEINGNEARLLNAKTRNI
jgi:hypothetical protein